MIKKDSDWIEYAPSPRGLHYLDTDFGNRIWRSNSGQLILETPPTPVTDINPPPETEKPKRKARKKIEKFT